VRQIPAAARDETISAAADLFERKNYQGWKKIMPHATHDEQNAKTNTRAPLVTPNATQRPRV
jgi:hypothetical protein